MIANIRPFMKLDLARTSSSHLTPIYLEGIMLLVSGISNEKCWLSVPGRETAFSATIAGATVSMVDYGRST
jgi:hypothetical protein